MFICVMTVTLLINSNWGGDHEKPGYVMPWGSGNAKATGYWRGQVLVTLTDDKCNYRLEILNGEIFTYSELIFYFHLYRTS